MRSRQLTLWQTSLAVVAMLLAHWLGTNAIAYRVVGKANAARAQSTTANTIPDYQHANGWRRTNLGWERMERITQRALPITSHISLPQLWPAAWALGMVILICSLPHSAHASAGTDAAFERLGPRQ